MNEEQQNRRIMQQLLDAAQGVVPDTHAIVVVVVNCETNHVSTATDLENEDAEEALRFAIERVRRAPVDGEIVTLKEMPS